MEQPGLVELFDTTLRDGTQGERVNLSIQDKLSITRRLDEFGIDIIEGGWPGSNPKDEEFFKLAGQLNLKHAEICAFGSTARYPDKIESDHNLNMLLKAETPVIAIFGKIWKLHSEKSLGLNAGQNEELIEKSVRFLKAHGRKIVFDAEHFFDGYKDDEQFAMKMLKAAERGGADRIVLCDTNGGTLPNQVRDIVGRITQSLNTPVGIHAHNDSELGVANSIAALEAGAVHVQGTINGVGERCGNANLCSLIPNALLKMNKHTRCTPDLSQLTSLSNYVYEIMNLVPNTRAAFVGKSAFAHKGGIHVSAVLKDSRMYEHIKPAEVGNKQRVLVSDLSGQSNIRYKAKELGIDLTEGKEFSKNFVQHIKTLEYDGYQFDGAEASFELLLRTELNEFQPYFDITYATINVMFDENGEEYSEAVLKVCVDGVTEHTASDGDGPVNALDNALRKALSRFYPEVMGMRLIDYKVRVLGDNNGTSAKVRVLVESSDGQTSWSTVGASENIIRASLTALYDSFNYSLLKREIEKEVQVLA